MQLQGNQSVLSKLLSSGWLPGYSVVARALLCSRMLLKSY